ncbi:hypothetical protein KBB49_00560 [Candidatus Saccharibacteria bacterium]|nr:hypothetical protein [Candidatus Saccharibacteria bacterium]
MSIFKSKKPLTRNANFEHKSTAPIMRYYRPPISGKSQRTTNDKPVSNNSRTNSESSRTSVFSLIYRWFGIIIILFLIVANTTISDAIVKINSDSQANLYRSLEEYREGINNIFESNFKNRSKFMLNSSSFETKIKTMFPEVESAVVVTPLAGRRLQVGLELEKPLARLNQALSNSQAVLSYSGTVVLEDDATLINEKFAQIPSISIPNITYSVGDQILTSSEAGLIRLLINEFDGSTPYRHKVKSIEFDVQKREIRVRFESVSYFAKLTPERESRVQVGALVSALKSMTEQSSLPTEYIDVRVDDRVFVK